MLKLHVIICSTRPGRVGESVGRWFFDVAHQANLFEVKLVDLAEVGLPIFDEPNHPRMRQYTKEHTKRWSALVEEADAFVFVTPEYNFSPPPSLVNALDYLYTEWNYKPCGFVSYGGISGGMRAVQVAKQMVTTLKMMPMVEAVNLVSIAEQVRDGKFQSNDRSEAAARTLLEELLKWATALKTIRE
jgi:NAD(P)H-dependent FMN reductase